MQSTGTGKVRRLDTVKSSFPAAGGRIAGEEQRLRAELAAVNALFEAAAMGEEGEPFARRLLLLAGKRGRR